MKEKSQHTRSVFLLLELLITFLLFCFAISVLLQIFARGAQLSQKVDTSGSALQVVQSIGAEIKTTDGSDAALQELFRQEGNNNTYHIYYNDRWEPVPGDGLYKTTITCAREQHNVLVADIEVYKKEERLSALQVKQYFPPQGVRT